MCFATFNINDLKRIILFTCQCQAASQRSPAAPEHCARSKSAGEPIEKPFAAADFLADRPQMPSVGLPAGLTVEPVRNNKEDETN